MASSPPSFLSATDWESIKGDPVEVGKAAEKYIEELNKRVSSAEAELRNAKINNQQLFQQIEVKYVEARKEFQEVSAELNQTKAELNAKKEELDVATKGKEEAVAALSAQQQKESSLVERVNLAIQDKNSLAEENSWSSKRVEQLLADLKSTQERLADAESSRSKLEDEVYSLKAQKSEYEFKKNNAEQAKGMVESHMKWLNQELEERNNALLQLRKELSEKDLNSQSNLNSLRDEKAALETELESMRSTNARLSTELRSNIEKKKECEDLVAQIRSEMTESSTTHQRLAALYKADVDEKEKKITELQSAIKQLSDMRTSWVEEEKKYITERDEALTAARSAKEELEQSKNSANKFKNLNTGVGQQSADISEAAARAMQERAARDAQEQGVSFTEVYAKYVEMEEQARVEQTERIRLEAYLEDILREIEEKAPAIQEQRAEYERVIEINETLNERLEVRAREIERLQHQIESTAAERLNFEREKVVLEQTHADLLNQVQLLISENLEKTRLLQGEHGMPAPQPPEGIIPDDLITFTSIQELQFKNMDLIKKLRNDEVLHSQQMDQVKEDCRKLITEKMQESETMIEEMREARNRQEQVLLATEKERDLYKVLLGEKQPTEDKENADNNAVIDNGASNDEAVRLVTQELETFKRDAGANLKMVEDHLDRELKASSKLRMDLAAAQAQAKFQEERYNTLAPNLEAQQREIQKLRENNQKLSSLLVDIETRLSHAKLEHGSAMEDVKRLNVELANSQAQGDMARASENRLLSELSSVKEEKNRLAEMMLSLQTLQKVVEESAEDGKKRLNGEVERLQRDFARAREELDEARRLAKDMGTSHEKVVADLRSKVETRDGELRETKENLVAARCHLDAEKQRSEMLKTQLEASDLKLGIFLNKESGEDNTGKDEESRIKEMETELNNAKLDNLSLKQALQHSQEHSKKFKEMAEKNEKDLKEMVAASDTFKATLESQRDDVQKTADRHLEQVRKLENDIEELRHTLEEKESEFKKRVEELKSESEGHKKAFDELTENTRTFREREQALMADVQTHAAIAKDAQENYEREVLLHSADISNLSKIKESLSSSQASVQEKEGILSETRAKLAVAEGKIADLEEKAAGKTAEMEEREKELKHQIDLLHSQLNTLSSQLRLIQSEHSAVGSSAEVSKKEDSESIMELREVIRFLRREKEIVDCEWELAKQEVTRMTQSLSHTEATLKEVRAQLDEELRHKDEHRQTASEHKSMMSQLETMNLLRESNVTLRDESERNLKTSKEWEAKARQNEAKIAASDSIIKTKTQEVEALCEEREALKLEITRWHGRVKQLTDKYQTVDPEKHQQLEREHAAAQKSIEELQESVKKLEGDLKTSKDNATVAASAAITERMNKLKHHAATWKKKADGFEQELNELKAAVGSVDEITALKEAKQGLDQELSQLRTANKNLETKIGQEGIKVTRLQQALSKANAAKASDADKDALTKELSEIKGHVPRAIQIARKAKEMLDAEKSKVTSLTGKVHALTAERDTLQATLKEKTVAHQEALELVQQLQRATAAQPAAPAVTVPVLAASVTDVATGSKRKLDEAETDEHQVKRQAVTTDEVVAEPKVGGGVEEGDQAVAAHDPTRKPSPTPPETGDVVVAGGATEEGAEVADGEEDEGALDGGDDGEEARDGEADGADVVAEVEEDNEAVVDGDDGPGDEGGDQGAASPSQFLADPPADEDDNQDDEAVVNAPEGADDEDTRAQFMEDPVPLSPQPSGEVDEMDDDAGDDEEMEADASAFVGDTMEEEQEDGEGMEP